MNPPSVLLDHSFLAALGDLDDDNHDIAVARYREMIDDFVEQRCLLVARADHLAPLDNQDLYAPIDKLHVARQHRNAATAIVARTGISIDEAITLVLIDRYRLRKVASFTDRFANFDDDQMVNVPSDFDAADAAEAPRPTALSPEAG